MNSVSYQLQKIRFKSFDSARIKTFHKSAALFPLRRMYQRHDYAVMILFHQDGGDGMGQRIRNPVIRPLVLHEVAVVGVKETFDIDFTYHESRFQSAFFSLRERMPHISFPVHGAVLEVSGQAFVQPGRYMRP